jgi:hypothetical protein
VCSPVSKQRRLLRPWSHEVLALHGSRPAFRSRVVNCGCRVILVLHLGQLPQQAQALQRLIFVNYTNDVSSTGMELVAHPCIWRQPQTDAAAHPASLGGAPPNRPSIESSREWPHTPVATTPSRSTPRLLACAGSTRASAAPGTPIGVVENAQRAQFSRSSDFSLARMGERQVETTTPGRMTVR